MRVAYVVGRYPAVSHTFILREVTALRALGVDVVPISIHRPTAADLLSEADRAEAARTYSVLPPSPVRMARAFVAALVRRPAGLARAFRLAMRLAQPGLRGHLRELAYLLEAVQIWHHCARSDVAHLHVHHLNQAANATMMAVAIEGDRADGRPRWTWSFTLHGPDELLDRTRFRLAEKALSADAIACISDFARSQAMAVLPESHWDKLDIVHCGLDPAVYRRSAPARNGAGPPFRILYVGRLVPVKGQAVLVEALAKLREEGHDVVATLIGTGPQKEAIERRAQDLGVADAVECVGAVGQDEIRAYYERSDAFVLPSFAEGVPVVLMEAMALEVPAVATQIAGVSELIEHDKSGLIVRPGRADLLAETIGRLVTDADLRARLARDGREKVARDFAIADAAATLRDLFERAAAAPPRAAQPE